MNHKKSIRFAGFSFFFCSFLFFYLLYFVIGIRRLLQRMRQVKLLLQTVFACGVVCDTAACSKDIIFIFFFGVFSLCALRLDFFFAYFVCSKAISIELFAAIYNQNSSFVPYLLYEIQCEMMLVLIEPNLCSAVFYWGQFERFFGVIY